MRARRRPLRDRRPRRRAAGGAERQRTGAGRARRRASRGVRAAQRDRPGCVAGWTDLATRFSRRGLAEALSPGIALARDGFEIQPKAGRHWRACRADLEGDAAAAFAPASPFRSPAIATALEHAVAGTFYSGPVAAAIASVSWLDEADLAAHENDWVEPVEFGYRDRTLLELPPNGQGSIAGWALEGLASPDPPAQVEALAEAYARGYATIGGTAYVCAADGEGMAVSLIQSVYHGFGSRVLVPGFGFVLQNRGAGLVARPPGIPTSSPRPSGRSTRSSRPPSSGRTGAGRPCSA